MKKSYLFIAAAALFAACSSDSLTVENDSPQTQNAAEQAVNFGVYVDRGLTRAGTPGTITTASLQTGAHKTAGFGVFAYYTDNTDYTQYATPNFMYNQQVNYNSTTNLWEYKPVKYWPNEFGTSANSDDVDKVSFFAYAPWIDVTPTSGSPASEKETNITQITKNTATGDPIIKYVVDTDPSSSVDLLWGVVPAADTYQAVNGTTAAPTLTAGLPYLDLVKAQTANRVKFNFRHALAKLNVQIDAFVDDITNSATLDSKTRIYVRSITLGGFAVKGALNLNNTSANEPLWLEYDGSKELTASTVTYYDGRKDGKEATTNGEQKSEKPASLNNVLIEDENTYVSGAFGGSAKAGVTNTPVNLFQTAGGADGYIYVIPTGEQMDVTIIYDVETIDANLPGYLADGATHGSSVENRIYKENVFTGNIDAGKAYQLKLHLGMTSVKFDAEVIDWEDAGNEDVDLPHNTRSVYLTPSATTVDAAGGNVTLAAQLGDGTSVSLSNNAYEGTVTTKTTTTPLTAGTLTGSNFAVSPNDKVYKKLYNIKLTNVSYDGATYATNSVSITQAPKELAFNLGSTTITALATSSINLSAANTGGTVDDWNADANITITVNGTQLVKGTDFTVTSAGVVNLTNPATAGIWVITIQAGDAATVSDTKVVTKLAGTLNAFSAPNVDFDDDNYTNASTAITGTQTTSVGTGEDGTITYSIAHTTGTGADATIDKNSGAVKFAYAPTVDDVYTVTATVADGVNYTYATNTQTYTITIVD
jgi:hypothetical protein